MKRTGAILIGGIFLTIVSVLAITYHQLKQVDDQYKNILSSVFNYKIMPAIIQFVTTEKTGDDSLTVKLLFTSARDWSNEHKHLENIDEKHKKYIMSNIEEYKTRPAELQCDDADLARSKWLNKHNIFIRLASKMFKHFSICVTDQLIDMVISKTDCTNMFIFFYKRNVLKILRFEVDQQANKVTLSEKRDISAGDAETSAIFFGLRTAIQK